MLGRLKMSVQECIDAYKKLSDEVFRPLRWMSLEYVESGLSGKGIRGKLDAAVLERAVKETLVKRGLPEDELLKDAPDAMCKV
jgi:hypothetical protein